MIPLLITYHYSSYSYIHVSFVELHVKKCAITESVQLHVYGKNCTLVYRGKCTVTKYHVINNREKCTWCPLFARTCMRLIFEHSAAIGYHHGMPAV